MASQIDNTKRCSMAEACAAWNRIYGTSLQPQNGLNGNKTFMSVADLCRSKIINWGYNCVCMFIGEHCLTLDLHYYSPADDVSLRKILTHVFECHTKNDLGRHCRLNTCKWFEHLLTCGMCLDNVLQNQERAVYCGADVTTLSCSCSSAMFDTFSRPRDASVKPSVQAGSLIVKENIQFNVNSKSVASVDITQLKDTLKKRLVSEKANSTKIEELRKELETVKEENSKLSLLKTENNTLQEEVKKLTTQNKETVEGLNAKLKQLQDELSTLNEKHEQETKTLRASLKELNDMLQEECVMVVPQK
jgi:hypothetical protein